MTSIRSCFYIALATASLSLAPGASAIPAYPGLQKGMLEDGTETVFSVVGDEYSHAIVSEDGFLLERRPGGLLAKTVKADVDGILGEGQRRAAARRLPGPSFPTTGNLKGVILLVEFSDNSFAEGHDSALFAEIMNGNRYSGEGATGSARDYFIDQSMGAFSPDFDVFGPIKLSKTMKYYGANDRNGQDSNPGMMVKEACEYAESELGVDFTNYDYNEDGNVDFVYVIYAGYAESYGASSNTIWPHASDINALGVQCEVSGKEVRRYACSSELKYVSGETVEGIGTFCHEFGHVLGLPDLYNTRNQSYIQLGTWDIMDQGSYNNESHTPPAYSAFERSSLGWMELTELDTPSDLVTLEELTESNTAYRISTPVEDEFFILENRQQRGWDTYQPGRGLMITHVAYDQGAWDGNYVNSGIVSRVDIEEADGVQSALTASSDLYPYGDNDMFTDYSQPSSMTWDRQPTGKGVTQIRDNDGVVTFRFMKDRLSRPEALRADAINEDSFTLSWSPVEGASHYRLNIREILPEGQDPVIYSEDFSGMEAGKYPNADMTDIGETLDEYLAMEGWWGEQIFQAGGKMMLGYYGKSGKLNSPAFSADILGHEATLAFSIVSYPGKSVNFSVSLLDIDTQEVVDNHEGKATKAEQDVIWHITDFPERGRFIFETRNERAYLDNLRILSGNVADDDVWTAGPKAWSEDAIRDHSFTVTGLVEGRTYVCSVEAWSEDGLHPSQPSEEIEVVTGRHDGVIEVSDSSNRRVASTSYYDFIGRRYRTAPSGIPFIKVTTFSDGSTETVKII